MMQLNQTIASLFSNIFKHIWSLCNQKKRYCSTISNSFEHVQKNMQLLHHYFQIVLNMLQIWCGQAWAGLAWAIERMMQSNKIIASLFPTVLNIFKIWCNQNKLLHHLLLSKEAFPFQKMLQSKQIIASLFPTVLNTFKIWCNQNKLLHHYFQTILNVFNYDAIKAKILHYYFRQFWAFLKYDAIKTNYCITIFKQSFNMFQIWWGKAGLGWPSLAWAHKNKDKIFLKKNTNNSNPLNAQIKHLSKTARSQKSIKCWTKGNVSNLLTFTATKSTRLGQSRICSTNGWLNYTNFRFSQYFFTKLFWKISKFGLKIDWLGEKSDIFGKQNWLWECDKS